MANNYSNVQNKNLLVDMASCETFRLVNCTYMYLNLATT